MSKNFFFIIIFSLLLISCSPKNVTLQDELKHLEPPYWYLVTQVAINTGYAGVPSTGEYDELTNFSVMNEVIEKEVTTTKPLLTMTAVGELAQQYVDKVDALKGGRSLNCFYHEQIGVEQVTICFENNQLQSFEHVRFISSHQREVFAWTLRPDN